MSHLTRNRSRPNFVMSPENSSTSLLGKKLVQKPSTPFPNETCSRTSRGSWLYLLKKLNVCLKILMRTGEKDGPESGRLSETAADQEVAPVVVARGK